MGIRLPLALDLIFTFKPLGSSGRAESPASTLLEPGFPESKISPAISCFLHEFLPSRPYRN